MEKGYSSERAAQLLISLLKQHGIKRIVASPGTTNITFVASAMYDPWFEIYSGVDERSAAYMAVGMAAETGEPVVISCTGATASRNYLPALTEAYYRKLPVLAVTASQDFTRVGNLVPQVLDRSRVPADAALKSYTVKAVDSDADVRPTELTLNDALLELRHHGGGPVHLNFMTRYCGDFSVTELPEARKIDRYTLIDKLPDIPAGRIAVFIGSHKTMPAALTEAIDRFCLSHNAVALCDHTSNFYGHSAVHASLIYDQRAHDAGLQNFDLLIHIGEVSGDYPTLTVKPARVWRVNEDGALRDTFGTLTAVFEMPEEEFFSRYSADNSERKSAEPGSLLAEFRSEYNRLLGLIPEDLPLSNIWIASQTAHLIPEGSFVSLAILNTLRCWNYFPLPQGVTADSNVGGFGIDGLTSTILGRSIANPSRLCFNFIGDLAFFYDLNAMGNRHIGPNIRILLINNGCGTEFRNYNHFAARFGDDAAPFIAADGHFACKSPDLVRHFAEDLGFEYLSASTKEQYLGNLDRFLTPEITDRPILLEVFTDFRDESDALYAAQHLIIDPQPITPGTIARSLLGDKAVDALKKLARK